jgi:putative FmdB family regulatory protein
MPVYEYECPECDHYFTDLKPIAEFKQLTYCPACGGVANKIISAPRLNTMRTDRRVAFETNERSAHEPRVSHQCGAHCHHHHHKKPAAEAKPELKQQVNRRPWMLGH